MGRAFVSFSIISQLCISLSLGQKSQNWLISNHSRLFDDVLVYGTKEEIKKTPPTVVIEIYDQDKVGKSEFIGRAIARPRIKLKENVYVTPTLEWFDISRGLDNAGELLAAFEMIEYGSETSGQLPEPKPLHTEYPRGPFHNFGCSIQVLI